MNGKCEIHRNQINLYFIVHSNVWKFEKIWLSSTLIIIWKPKMWRMDMRIPIYPPTLVERGYTKGQTTIYKTLHIKLKINF